MANTLNKYHRRIPEVLAVKWSGRNFTQILAVFPEISFSFYKGIFQVHSLSPTIEVAEGEWIVEKSTPEGKHYYKLDDATFIALYEPS